MTISARVIYLVFFYIGLNYSLAGIATPFVAEKFSVEQYMVGYAYSMYSVGQTLGVLGNIRFLGQVAPKQEIRLAVLLLVIAIIGMTAGDGLVIFSLSVFFLGAGVGIFVSVANYFIVATWEGRGRTTKINLMNFFFSFGAIVSPVTAGVLLAHGVEWENLYHLAGLFLVLVAVFAQHIPATVKLDPGTLAAAANWGPAVYLTGFALFTYVLSEIVISFWVVSYLRHTLNLGLASAGFYLSLFWGMIAVGRFCSGLLARRFAAYPMILAGSALAFVSYIGFLLSVNPVSCAVFIAMMGLGCSGLYASILSYGSQQAAPSPRLTTFLVSIGCAGGVLSYLLSSLMNQLFGLTVAMAFGAVLLGVVFMLIFFADRMRDEKLPGTADKSMAKGC